MLKLQSVGSCALLTMSISSVLYADPVPPQNAPVLAEPTDVKISFAGLLFGGEVAVRPSVYNGMPEATVTSEVAIAGLESSGAKSTHDRSRLLEWDMTGRLKAGLGNPADTNTGVNPAGALGFQLAGRLDYGILPLEEKCATLYLSAGAGSELKATAMDPARHNGAMDSIGLSSADARADIYIRAGVGVACVSNELVFVVSPYVAWRADSIAISSGKELGLRGTLLAPSSLAVVLEAATMASHNAAGSDRTTRASLSLRKALGDRLRIGVDAAISRNDLDYMNEVFYKKRVTPFAASGVASLAF